MSFAHAPYVNSTPRQDVIVDGAVVKLTRVSDLDRIVVNGKSYEMWNAARADYAAGTVPMPSGYSLDRFEVRNGDLASGDIKNSHPFERSQYGLNAAWPMGTEVWTSFAMMFVRGWICQGGNVLWGMPPENLNPKDAIYSSQVIGSLYKNRFQIECWHSGENPMTASTRVLVCTGPIVIGRFVNIVQCVKFDPKGAGYLRVWMDGSEIAYYRGPIGLASATDFSFKWGQYRGVDPDGVTDGRSVIWFANVEAGDSALASRISAPKAIPQFRPW